VSTSIGAEGLDIRNGVNIFIEDNLDRFAIRIVDLLQDKPLSTIVGSAARELAKTTYDWKNIVQKLENDFCGLLLE
jgi:glycosyltransferase involved in cell wall biosynthesis